jgi:hypothetical protein
MSTLKFNQWLNTDNTENYKCRAWVNFNGTGTVAIRASNNVSSITDNGTGDYTVNFTTAVVDANYSVAGFANSSNNSAASSLNYVSARTDYAPSTTSFRVYVKLASNDADSSYVNIAVFR